MYWWGVREPILIKRDNYVLCPLLDGVVERIDLPQDGRIYVPFGCHHNYFAMEAFNSDGYPINFKNKLRRTLTSRHERNSRKCK